MEVQIDSAHAACFIGRQKIVPALLSPLQTQITSLVQAFIEAGVDTFFVGGGRGFDALAAHVVFRLQAQYPKIRLILVLPFSDPCEKEDDWTPEEIQTFHQIRAQASQVILLHSHSQPDRYEERNRYLVDHTQFCLCYQTSQTDHTAYATQYAKSQGRSVYNFAKKIKKTGEK